MSGSNATETDVLAYIFTNLIQFPQVYGRVEHDHARQ